MVCPSRLFCGKSLENVRAEMSKPYRYHGGDGWESTHHARFPNAVHGFEAREATRTAGHLPATGPPEQNGGGGDTGIAPVA